MARKRQESALGCTLLLILGIPVLFVNWISDKTGIPAAAAWIAIAIIILALISAFVWAQDAKIRALRIADIDSMSGTEFEQYLRRLLGSRGYSVSITGASGDLGVDLIASCPQERIAIQVKRHTGKVSRRAISDAVGGMQHYRCNKAMVITNSYFTPGAIILARSNRCTLVDRDQLTQWIIQYQAHSRSHARSSPLPQRATNNTGASGGLINPSQQSQTLQTPREPLLQRFRHAVTYGFVNGWWACLAVALVLILILAHSFQGRPVVDKVQSPKSTMQTLARTPSASPTVEIGREPLPNTQIPGPDSTPFSGAPYYLTPAPQTTVTPTPIPTPMLNPNGSVWPDGKIVNHPEHFVETRLINVPPNDTLNLRSGPGARFPSIAKLPADTSGILVFDQDQVWDGDTWWCPVEWNGFRGYVSRRYLPK
jgi:restriction system protein